nr:glycine receptor subunit alpha 1 [Hymenolepis microstoma]
MPMKKCEIGWMYHVNKKSNKVHKLEPPISSIPGIGLHPDDLSIKTSSKALTNLRSTDTPFIRLQKLGGRKNLLCFQENVKDNSKRDIECEKTETNFPNSDYIFKVPIYMQHPISCMQVRQQVQPQKIAETSCTYSPNVERKRCLKSKIWNPPVSRPGYSEYNRNLPPYSFVRKEFIYPEAIKYYKYPTPVEYNVYDSLKSVNHDVRNFSFKSQRDVILNKIFKNYKAHERPTEFLDESTVVKVNMKILAIFSVDVRNMDYYVDALLRQTWMDPRLKWEHLPEHSSYTTPIVSPNLKEQVWLPDLFFRNGKDGYLHKMTLPNYLLRVYPNGKVLYSQKITMRFDCQMELHNFPMDEQVCNINIGSYGYTLDELRFDWTDKNALELPKDLQISEFNSPPNYTIIDCTEEASTSTGNYTCLLVQFHLSRQLSSYLVTTYIPNALIIMVSWVSFWVPADAAPARVPLGLLCLQGLCTQAVSISSSLPRVSYTKAIDVWLICSIIFVVSVMAEYALALSVINRERLSVWRLTVRRIVREELARWWKAVYTMEFSKRSNRGALVTKQQADVFNHVVTILSTKNDLILPKTNFRMLGEAESMVDGYSRVLFPIAYLIDLPDQPESLSDLLTHKYAEKDYVQQRKLWREYTNKLNEFGHCQTTSSVTAVTSRFTAPNAGRKNPT